MEYIELTIKVSRTGNLNDLVESLTERGFSNLVINDPEEIDEMLRHLDETEWCDREQVDIELPGEPSVILYFNQDEEGDRKALEIEGLVEELNGACGNAGEDEMPYIVSKRIQSDEAWKDKWKEYFYPTRVSERIIVAPSWASDEEIESEAGINDESIIVRIDPGVAFGTGTHETTALSIRLLEEFIREGDKVLDVGTGSGILAIVSSRLGASEVLGIDIDSDAVDTARKNVALEMEVDGGESDDSGIDSDGGDRVKCRIEIREGDLTEGVDFEADIVVANLLTDLVIRFTPDAKKHLKPGGIFISSGILIEHQDRVLKNLEEHGFHVMKVLEQGEWCAVAAK